MMMVVVTVVVTVVVQCIQASREEAKRSPQKNSRAMLCLLCYAVDKGNKKIDR